MASSAFLEAFKRGTPNRSRLIREQREAARRAAHPPPIYGPPDLDNPISFLQDYDHAAPAMPLRTSASLPSYNRMILTPTEQVNLQRAFAALTQVLLHRVDLPEVIEEYWSPTPDVLSTDSRTQLNTMANSSTTSEKSKGKQPESTSLPLGNMEKIVRFEIIENSPAVQALRSKYSGQKRGIDQVDADDDQAGPSSRAVRPKKRSRSKAIPEDVAWNKFIASQAIKDRLGQPSTPTTPTVEGKVRKSIIGRLWEPAAVNDALNKTTSPKSAQKVVTAESVAETHPQVVICSPPSAAKTFPPEKKQKGTNPTHLSPSNVSQDGSDDVIMEDVNIDKTRNRRPDSSEWQEVDDDASMTWRDVGGEKARRSCKADDPTYRESKPDSAQEAADDAIRPDFDDITPSKPGKLVDPTFKPTQEDEDDDIELNASVSISAKKGPQKKVNPKGSIVTFGEKPNMGTPANAPIVNTSEKILHAKSALKKTPPPPKKSQLKPAADESESQSESEEEAPVPKKTTPKKKITPKKKTPAKKAAPKKSVGKRATPKEATPKKLAVEEPRARRTSPRLSAKK